MNIFEIASREKLRFNYKGIIAVEDLWDLNLSSLDELYRYLSGDLKDKGGEGLIKREDSDSNKLLQLSLDIIRHIFEVKEKENDEAKMAQEKSLKKQKIMEIIASKQDESLKEQSIDDLKEMLKNL